ncbi:MAG TPA: class I SAM-dependent methyltransferase [Allocoleopsis sp.]
MSYLINEVETKMQIYNRLLRNGVGAEIGVCRGINATALYVSTKPSKFYLVDIWEDNPDTKKYHPVGLYYDNWMNDVSKLFDKEIENNIVELHRKTSIEFLSSLPDGHLDWVYLDADHNYEAINAEIALCVKKVKSGGYIAGHDFMVHDKAWKTGPIRAVIEHIQAGTIKMEALTCEIYSSYLCRVL